MRLQEPRNKRLVEPAAAFLASILLLLHRGVSEEGLLFTINLVLAGVEVSSMRLHHLGLHEELVTEDAEKVDGDTLNSIVSKVPVSNRGMEKTYEVTSNEVLPVKVAIFALGKDREVLGDGNQDAEEQSNVGSNQTERSDIGHLVLGNALSTTSADEENVRYQKRDPGQETKNGGKVDKVAENNLGVICGVHEGGAAEQGRDTQSWNGHTSLVSPAEDLGSVALLGETVKGTGSNVQIRVGGTEGEEEDTGVQDGREVLDAGDLDGDNKRRGGRTSGCAVSEGELLGVVGDKHAEEEDGQAVEEQDPVEGELDGAGNGLARVLRLTDGHTNQLGTKVGEDGVDQGAPKTVEFASAAFSVGRLKCTRVLVVLETGSRARTSTDSKEKREDNHTDNGNDLYRTQPELKFTEELDTEVVDGADCDEENRNPYTGVDFAS